MVTPKLWTTELIASISWNSGLVMKKNQPQSISRSNCWMPAFW